MDDKQKKLEEIKELVEKFKEKILEKFDDYVQGISLLPPAKDEKDKINLLLLIDEAGSQKLSREQIKEKLSKVIEQIVNKVSKKLNPQIILKGEIIQDCFDSKYEKLNLIANSAIIHDKGLLSALKVSEVHKTMILEKFQKYIVSYIVGGSIVTDTASPDSDIDSFVIVDDTDVKGMTRTELKDKLRAIIIGMAAEIKQQLGIKRDFHIQVYILTDFWDNLKEANPVIFTVLRNGLPIYDRGTFMPWKQLLSMGKIKPSPEAIDMLVHTGEQMLQRVNLKLKEIGLEDFFWAGITSSQAAIMLYGYPPPTPKEAPKVLRDLFIKKEKLLKESDIKKFEKILKIRKQIEKGTITKVTGKEIDELNKMTREYLDTMSSLFEKIQKYKEKEDINTAKKDLETVEKELKKQFEVKTLKELEEKNKVPPFIPKQREIIKADIEKFEKGKLSRQDTHKTIKRTRAFIKDLIEIMQKDQMIKIESSKIRIKHGDTLGEIVYTQKGILINQDVKEPKYYLLDKKAKEISPEKYNELLETKKAEPILNVKIYEQLEKIFGKNMEIVMKR